MGEEHSSALTFSLEESVWLNQGEKIKEVLSLGLEPDIRIEEKYDYVDIKGGLYLNGEYYPEAEKDGEDVSEQTAAQYVEKRTQREDGVGELQHFFPVDVTVPLNRIQNLDDVYVNIDSFDYDLPEPGCIQLTADVSITGVKDPEERQHQEDSGEYTVPEAMPIWEMEETYQSSSQDTAHEEETAAPEIPEVREEVPVEEEESNEETEDDSIVTAFYGREPEEMEEQTEPAEREEEAMNSAATPSSEETEPEENTERDDNALYLTKMMTSGEEDFSRLKMCIIQENESLEQIADRYHTTTAHLLRFNRLDHDHVEEGQILYIPAPASATKHEES